MSCPQVSTGKHNLPTVKNGSMSHLQLAQVGRSYIQVSRDGQWLQRYCLWTRRSRVSQKRGGMCQSGGECAPDSAEEMSTV